MNITKWKMREFEDYILLGLHLTKDQFYEFIKESLDKLSKGEDFKILFELDKKGSTDI